MGHPASVCHPLFLQFVALLMNWGFGYQHCIWICAGITSPHKAHANKSGAGVQGQCLLTEAPAAAAPAQLADLHIALAPEPNQAPAGANGCGPPAAH